MFSGKSSELLRRVRRARRAHIPVVLCKPVTDSRSPTVRSHDGLEGEAILVRHGAQIVQAAGELSPGSLVAVDEAQFLDGMAEAARSLVASGYFVALAGLDLDYRGLPFGEMPLLLALADEVVKLSAVCVQCGAEATRTQRLVGGRPAGLGELVLIGGAEAYEPRCLACWVDPLRVELESAQARSLVADGRVDAAGEDGASVPRGDGVDR